MVYQSLFFVFSTFCACLRRLFQYQRSCTYAPILLINFLNVLQVLLFIFSFIIHPKLTFVNGVRQGSNSNFHFHENTIFFYNNLLKYTCLPPLLYSNISVDFPILLCSFGYQRLVIKLIWCWPQMDKYTESSPHVLPFQECLGYTQHSIFLYSFKSPCQIPQNHFGGKWHFKHIEFKHYPFVQLLLL